MKVAWDEQQKLENATRVGKEVMANARDSWTPVVWGVVEDEVSLVVDGAKHVIQRVRLAKGVSWDGSEYGYKTGAFLIDPRTGAVKWAQYSQVLSESEYTQLLARARAKGWPIC
ncbi:MAG: hypothetical protein HYU41_00040 [Candidatus Rokubacteria bacterium]|nr:hypothetical protein [Candidatus Rokubacteria bacterium]